MASVTDVDKTLHDMLKDAPMMNDSTSAVHSGFVNSQEQNLKTENDKETITSPISSSYSKFPLTKIETIKCWGVSTYKCTRQLMFEKLGKTSRTVDKDLEIQIEFLRDTQKKYANLLRLSRIMTGHFHHIVQTQQTLSEVFTDLSQKSPELLEEFKTNSETQKSLAKNGELLLNALNLFLSSISTLCNKTIEDTLMTVRHYESARIEYDAYRMDLETLAATPRCEANTARIDDAQMNYQKYKEEFEKLRGDVEIKLKFLENNRIKVMRKHLQLLNSAICAYFTGNAQALEETLQNFCKRNSKEESIESRSTMSACLER